MIRLSAGPASIAFFIVQDAKFRQVVLDHKDSKGFMEKLAKAHPSILYRPLKRSQFPELIILSFRY